MTNLSYLFLTDSFTVQFQKAMNEKKLIVLQLLRQSRSDVFYLISRLQRPTVLLKLGTWQD